ncbi:hypothetical protein [Pseudarthrobacter sp. DSP2-3-2b1]|uniref:hypothetical protein n=1 Tax=Pseudarthrobacter sp. DSP2-3-2b1 TaxID=2804661 RepID=UPI003CF8708D
MNTGLTSRALPDRQIFLGLEVQEVSGAGDEEVFETKASPPAVAGPLTATIKVPADHACGSAVVLK